MKPWPLIWEQFKETTAARFEKKKNLRDADEFCVSVHFVRPSEKPGLFLLVCFSQNYKVNELQEIIPPTQTSLRILTVWGNKI